VLLISQRTGAIVVVPTATEPSWTRVRARDRTRRIEDEFYLVAREMLQSFEGFVGELRSRGPRCQDPTGSDDIYVDMNVNRVVLTGNLTGEPELRQLSGGNSLCRLRLACNTRRRQPDGNWGEKPNYFDVVVWGSQGEAASRFLSKGSAVAVDGRLEWREWSTPTGENRQAVEIVAESLQFLDRPSSDHDQLTPEPEGELTPGEGVSF
jgi:single-strand DNA-binding protein